MNSLSKSALKVDQTNFHYVIEQHLTFDQAIIFHFSSKHSTVDQTQFHLTSDKRHVSFDHNTI